MRPRCHPFCIAERTISKNQHSGWSRGNIAERLARDIPEGWYVNLGVGIPTDVANHVSEDREVIFQSENGILGFGRVATGDEISPWLQNAGKQPVTLRSGGSYFHHADSFAQIRGGHLDLCVLGAYQVALGGDLANWSTGKDLAPSIGGAMDLAMGTKRVWITMEHVTRDGDPKLVDSCSYPLTAVAVVSRIYTNLAVLEVGEDAFDLIELAPGITFDELQAQTGAPIRRSEVLRGGRDA